MDDVKINNFIRDNPDETFPKCKTLSSAECMAVRQHVTNLLRLPSDVDGLQLVNAIRQKATVVPGVDANTEAFNLKQLPIPLHDSVYLNWKRFDSVDCMRVEDVNRWFEYLWYPAADDLDIVDSRFEWIVSVAHSGEVYLVEGATTGRHGRM